jgi:hypothetical protein
MGASFHSQYKIYFYSHIVHQPAVFVCTGTLAVLDALDDSSCLDRDTCAWWLSERQLPNGGLNGRPEKLEDVSNHFPLSTSCVGPSVKFVWLIQLFSGLL